MSRLKAVLFALTLAVTAYAANVVTTTYSAADDRDGDAAATRVEVIQVVFDPGEEGPAAVVLRNVVHEATAADPRVPVDLICAIGGAMTAQGCDETKAQLDLPKGSAISFEPTRETDPSRAPRPPRVETARRRSRNKWKGVFTIIRTISSGITTGITAMLSKGADWKQAVIVGGTAGAWSGLMQWKNRKRLNWLVHRDWLAVSPPEEHERAGVLKRYFKRSIQTGVYGALMSASFYYAGVNHDLFTPESAMRLLTMTAESLYTQTAWEVMNQQWTEAAIARDPEKAQLYENLSALGSLTQSLINVTANALNIGGVHVAGIHLGTVVSGTVGTAGVIVYGWRWLPKSVRKPFAALASGCRGIVELFTNPLVTQE